MTPEQMVQDAVLLDRGGHMLEAAAAYERVLRRWPALADCWYNLGILRRKLRDFDAALACYRRAIELGVSEPEQVHLNCAVIYADHLYRESDAERELNTALALNPDYVPALLNLANLNEDLGKRDQAAALYEKILVIDASCWEALARYARLQSVQGPNERLVAMLRSALANTRIGVADKASVGFALGGILDASGDFAGAFESYQRANMFSRQCVAPTAGPYDANAEARYFDLLISTFDGRRLSNSFLAGTSKNPTRPIFICGMFRSGSTLAEHILAAHPRVRAGGELDFLPNAARSTIAPFPQAMRSITVAQLGSLAQDYLGMLGRLFPGAEHVTDKRPDNFLYIGLIKLLFPNAKIVHTVRNALDNCLSVYFLHLDQSKSYALDLVDTGRHYREYRRLMDHWKALYRNDIFDLDYDLLVREPRTTNEQLLKFCGLKWDERCLATDRTVGVVKTASNWQVREPLYQRSSGRWRHYADYLGPLRAVLGDLGPREERTDSVGSA